MTTFLKSTVAKATLGLFVSAAVVFGGAASAKALTQAEATAIITALGLSGSQAAVIQALVSGGSTTTTSSYDFGTATLRVGSTGQYVTNLQMFLNSAINAGLTTDGVFGQGTKAKVAAWQSVNGLVADGVFGPASMAKAKGTVVTTPTSPTTPTTPGTLTGGAGSIDLSGSSDEEDKVKEGDTEKVASFEIEADGSDIAVTHIKVYLANRGTGSERLTDYVEEVSVWMGDKEVGSVDARDFSRDSGTPDIFSQTIALSGAVVEEGDEETFSIGVTAESSIDSDDIADSDWVVEVNTIRYQDATGAILTETADNDMSATDDSDYDETFNFADSSADDDIAIKSSTKDPKAMTIEVDADDESEETLIGVFRLDVDEDSSDIQINDLPVVITFGNYDTDEDGTVDGDDDSTSDDAANRVIDSVVVSIDGEEFDADLDAVSITNGAGTATYIVSLDDGDAVIDAGDVIDVEIYVVFNEQEDNYNDGVTVRASVDGGDIDAEGESDDVDVDGSYTGKVHTLSADAPIFELVSKNLELFQSIDGVATGEEDIFVAEFVFEVTAPEDTVIYLPLEIDDDDGIEFTVSGGAEVDSAVIDAEDNNIEEDETFMVAAGETEEFTVSVYLRGNNASNNVQITSFWYALNDEADEVDGDLEVTAGLTDFKTKTVYLAK